MQVDIETLLLDIVLSYLMEYHLGQPLKFSNSSVCLSLTFTSEQLSLATTPVPVPSTVLYMYCIIQTSYAETRWGWAAIETKISGLETKPRASEHPIN